MNILPVSVIIVYYSCREDLVALLNSLNVQTALPAEVLIIDNSLQLNMEGEILNLTVKILRPQKNLGFCAGNNLGINSAKSPFLFFCNPDVVLQSKTIELLHAFLNENNKIAAAGPKLLSSRDPKFIDSAGIEFVQNRQFKNYGEGELDRPEYNVRREVFGLCAAALMIKRQALEDIALNLHGKREYFDDDFFAYKDDVDLAYRLHHRDWKLYYVPEVVAYHKRSVVKLKKDKIKVDDFSLRSLSWRNHFFVLIKNEPLSSLFKNCPRIFWPQFKKLIFLIFFQGKNVLIMKEIIKLLPKMLAKRKQIFATSINYER